MPEGEPDARAARVRGGLGWVLTVLAVLATALALVSVWTFRTLTDTELFVDRVASVIAQPEVAAAVGDTAALQIVDALEVEDRLRGVLPEELAALAAAPISSAARTYLAEGATALVQTEAFRSAWESALAGGHRISIGILSGTDTRVIENSDGIIVLDVAPVVNLLLAEGSDFVADLLGREVSAAVVTPETIEDAVATLEEQLGTDLPADFGQVVLFASDDLATAQTVYQSLRVAVWLMPIAALVLIGLAVAMSASRLRTAMVIVVGTGMMMLLVGLALQPLQSSIVDAVETASLAGAVSAGFDTVFSSLRSAVVVVVVLAIAACVVLFLTGDSRAAASGRELIRRAPGLAAAHRGWFLGGGALLALGLLAVLPGRSFGQVLVVGLVYAGYALVVVLAPRRPVSGVDD